MSILSWLLKPRLEMAKADTKPVRLGKYIITAHAQNRTVDRRRNLGKTAMLRNLFGISSRNSEIYAGRDGTAQYDRVNPKSRTISHITKSNRVKTFRRFHDTPYERRKAYKYFKR